MTNNDCKQLREQYLSALERWLTRATHASRWVSRESLDHKKYLRPQPLDDMIADYEAEESAREEFIQAHDEYWACKEEIKPAGSLKGASGKTGAILEEYDAEKEFRRGNIEPGKFGPTVEEYDAEELTRGNKLPPKFGASIGEYNPD